MLLVVLIVGAIGGATWSFTREGGEGNPEDPAKVLIVRRGQTVGYSIMLEDAGFDAAERTFADWERKAEEEVPELQETGVAAIMRLADRFGFGYIAFEYPQDVDFSALAIDVPPFEDHVRFAVVSVGDFAFPPVMTVNPPPSEVMRDPSIMLLGALFEQELLAQAREDGDHGLDALKLRDRLPGAIDRLDRVPVAERMAESIAQRIEEELVDRERAEPRPKLLGDPLESITAVPLADGSILTSSRKLSIVSSDGVRPDVDLDDSVRFYAVPPGDGARQECDSLLGGELSDADSPRYKVAVDGSAVLTRTLTEGLVLFVLQPPGHEAVQDQGGQAGPVRSCDFVRAGRVPPPMSGLRVLGVPGPNGQVARAGTTDGFGVVTVVRAGSTDRQMLAMIEGAELHGPAWLDGHHMAARADFPADAPDALYFLSTEQPLAVLALEASVFENASRIGEVVAGPVLDGRRTLFVTAVDDRADVPTSKLYRVELPGTAADLFAEPPTAPEGEVDRRDGMPTVIPLDSNAFSVRTLTHHGRVYEPAPSPDGRFVAFRIREPELDRPDEADDDEIGLLILDESYQGGRMRLLTRNALEDYKPRFTADGSTIVFRTRYRIPRTSWVMTAGRTVAPPALARARTAGGSEPGMAAGELAPAKGIEAPASADRAGGSLEPPGLSGPLEQPSSGRGG